MVMNGYAKCDDKNAHAIIYITYEKVRIYKCLVHALNVNVWARIAFPISWPCHLLISCNGGKIASGSLAGRIKSWPIKVIFPLEQSTESRPGKMIADIPL